MARRRKGRDISGWLVIDKPSGIGSTEVVNIVRRALNAKKAGHAGTLDPQATGVQATKTVPYVTDALKAYVFTVRFGQATETDDAEGAVIAESDHRPTDAEIKAALGAFVGEIMQVPPAYSAVRVAGERAYALARGGQAAELEARPLWVESLILADRPDRDHAELEMVCGKGGYVRAVARDLGEALGCLGHVTALRRVWSGPFSVEEAVTLEQIEALPGTPELDAKLLPLEAGLEDLPRAHAPAESVGRLRNGNPATVIASGIDYGEECWAEAQGRAIAVGRYRGGTLHPSRVFNA
jgi:tRNA pseudouridine55 synthase